MARPHWRHRAEAAHRIRPHARGTAEPAGSRRAVPARVRRVLGVVRACRTADVVTGDGGRCHGSCRRGCGDQWRCAARQGIGPGVRGRAGRARCRRRRGYCSESACSKRTPARCRGQPSCSHRAAELGLGHRAAPGARRIGPGQLPAGIGAGGGRCRRRTRRRRGSDGPRAGRCSPATPGRPRLPSPGSGRRRGHPDCGPSNILESVPALRNDPRYLVIAVLAAGWIGEPERVMSYFDRRLEAARARGAIGVLPLAPRPDRRRRRFAGPARAELCLCRRGGRNGHRARVRHRCRVGSHDLGDRVGGQGAKRRGGPVDGGSETTGRHRRGGRCRGARFIWPEAFCALSPAANSRWSSYVLEDRLTVDEGRLPRGDYPLSRSHRTSSRRTWRWGGGRMRWPWLLDMPGLHRQSDDPGHPRAAAPHRRNGGRRRRTPADALFHQAHDQHAMGSDPLAAARTRLLHGARLRLAGRRVAARVQLRIASDAFRTMGFDAWTARTEDELAATGAHRPPWLDAGDSLTSQETRVALLVARGQTNRDIATALFPQPENGGAPRHQRSCANAGSAPGPSSPCA